MIHPILTLLTRAHVREALVAGGTRFVRAVALAAQVDEDTVAAALSQSPPEATAEVVRVGKIGDGTLLKAFTDFLNSDIGKLLVDAIRRLILGS